VVHYSFYSGPCIGARGVWFVGGLLGLSVGFLVAFDPVVAGTLSYFDPDHWLLAAEFGDVLP